MYKILCDVMLHHNILDHSIALLQALHSARSNHLVVQTVNCQMSVSRCFENSLPNDTASTKALLYLVLPLDSQHILFRQLLRTLRSDYCVYIPDVVTVRIWDSTGLMAI